MYFFFLFQAEDGIRDGHVTGVQTCALPIFGDGVETARAGNVGRDPWRNGQEPGQGGDMENLHLLAMHIPQSQASALHALHHPLSVEEAQAVADADIRHRFSPMVWPSSAARSRCK